MSRFVDYIGGVLTQVKALVTSTGVADANKVVATGADGKLDESLMPASLTLQVKVLPATEDIAAGDFVNVFDDAGTVSVRLADASAERPADGYVKAGALTGANATVYLEGVNNQLTGLAPGQVWLGDAGQVTQTAPASGGGGLAQIVGQAIAATELDFEKAQPIYLADS